MPSAASPVFVAAIYTCDIGASNDTNPFNRAAHVSGLTIKHEVRPWKLEYRVSGGSQGRVGRLILTSEPHHGRAGREKRPTSGRRHPIRSMKLTSL
jgi:hypothetical protein